MLNLPTRHPKLQDDEVQVKALFTSLISRESRLKHTTSEHNEKLLVSTPSSDPNDPISCPSYFFLAISNFSQLNRFRSRKILSTVCMCVYTFMGQSLTPRAWRSPASTPARAHLSVLWLGCLAWQPLALEYGKRLGCLFYILATMITQLWAPYARSGG